MSGGAVRRIRPDMGAEQITMAGLAVAFALALLKLVQVKFTDDRDARAAKERCDREAAEALAKSDRDAELVKSGTDGAVALARAAAEVRTAQALEAMAAAVEDLRADMREHHTPPLGVPTSSPYSRQRARTPAGGTPITPGTRRAKPEP